MTARPSLPGVKVLTFADLVAVSKVYGELMREAHGLPGGIKGSRSGLSEQELATLEHYDRVAKQELVIMYQEANADQIVLLEKLEQLNFRIPEPTDLDVEDRPDFIELFSSTLRYESLLI